MRVTTDLAAKQDFINILKHLKMSSKTHYRKVFKSDHLGVADLEDFLEEGVVLDFTIKQVKQEIGVKVAGRTGNFNIAYFNEPIKPLVLNVTNSKIVSGFSGGSPFVEDWKDIRVTLYIDANVKMKGEIVGGVRIRKVQPQKDTDKPEFTEKHFAAAKKQNATITKIKSRYSLDKATETKYLEYAAAK